MPGNDQSDGKRPDYHETPERIMLRENGGILGEGYNWGTGRFSRAAEGAGEEMLRGKHRPGKRDGS